MSGRVIFNFKGKDVTNLMVELYIDDPVWIKDIPVDYAHPDFDTLVEIIRSKNVKALKKILNKSNLELVDSQDLTVLHIAVRWGNVDTLRMLLEDRRTVRLLDHQMYNGDTPLLAAARYDNIAAVRLLAEYGADLNHQESNSGNTILHFAARIMDTDLMNTLLSHKHPSKLINTTNIFGETALDIALKEHSPTFQALLQAGADYSKSNIFTGRNILHTSVAYNQCGIVRELLSSAGPRSLVDLNDFRGDTPLMLAVRMACFPCVKSLIGHMKPGMEVNINTKESILHIATRTDQDEILKYLLMFSHEKLINYKESNGLTPLLLAIEHDKNKCLDTLTKTQNIYVKNEKTQETALHTAIRVNNRLALALLLQSKNNVLAWLFAQKDIKGRSPFWLAVENGHAPFIIESRKGGWVDVDELNYLGDSPTFVAAACGHLRVLKALLLSEKYYQFCKESEKDSDLKEQKLIRNAEICCDIYNSDIFILTDQARKNKFHTWVPKSFLRSNKKTGRNIFHACALGGDLDCLHFIYTLITFFNFELESFDSPDKKGNTPLLLATKNNCGGPACVYFFLSNKANITSTNKSGDFVLNSMFINTEKAIDLLFSLLTAGILYDTTARGLQEESECLQVDFSLFQPPDEPLTKVVKLFFECVQGPQRTKFLQHTLFKIYIHLILLSVNYVFHLRFFLSCLSTILLTIYLLLFAGEQKDGEVQSKIAQYVRYSLFVLNILGILFSVPLLFHENIFLKAVLSYSLMLLPCFFVIFLIMLPYDSTLSFEIASLTVLLSWLSLMMYSTAVFKEISNQIAMLSQVVYGMMVYFRIVFCILLAFSLAFFCIFNDNPYFVTPNKSFVYTTFVLLHGDTIESFDYFNEKHFATYSNNSDVMKMTYSQLDLFLESTLLAIFIVTCVLVLLNMLVGLAVRDGRTLAADGEVFRRRLQINWMFSLEAFLNSFLYRILRNTPIIYFLGIIPSKTLIHMKSSYLPLVERDSFVFTRQSVMEIKKSVSKSPKHESARSGVPEKLIAMFRSSSGLKIIERQYPSSSSEVKKPTFE